MASGHASMKPVLIDGSHFLSRTATGIGSYARTLAATLRSAGCQVAVLYGQRIEARHGPPLRLAAQVFGNPPSVSKRMRLLRDAPFLLRAAAGGGRRSRAIQVPVDGIEVSTFEPALPPCDQVLNAHAVFERAQRLFLMKERFIEVEMPGPCKAAHWSGPLPVRARGMPNIYTLHDLIPLQYPHFVLDYAGGSVALHAAIARQADHIVTVSETSKRHIVDLLRVPEERVSVTYEPAPSLPKIAPRDAERLVESVYRAEPGGYALFVGAIEPKKNLKRLIEAFLLAGLDIPLLIAGPLGWLYDEDLALIDVIAGSRSDELPPVRRLGYLPRRHLVALMQCARFLVFPSLYEGSACPRWRPCSSAFRCSPPTSARCRRWPARRPCWSIRWMWPS